MKAFRFPFLVNKATPFPQRRLLALSFSSSANPRFRNFSQHDGGGDYLERGSAVYKHALKFQRPTTIKWNELLINNDSFIPPEALLANRVSFIGSVASAVQEMKTETVHFGAYTFLHVHTSRDSRTPLLRIKLEMWGEVAELASKHLKPNDFIYVSGCLGSYPKVNLNGDLRLEYKVTVKGLDYVVAQNDKESCPYEELKSSGANISGADQEKYRNRLYLWQVFFANPHEWWDYRRCKANPNQPDFKHRDSGEALWLRKNDPSWIRKQLELLDSKAEHGQGVYAVSRNRASHWVYDEQ